MNQNTRLFVVVMFGLGFLLVLVGVALIPTDAWRFIADWQKVSLAFNLLVAFCSVLLAYSVYVDGGDIKNQRYDIAGILKTMNEIREESKELGKDLDWLYDDKVKTEKKIAELEEKLRGTEIAAQPTQTKEERKTI